MKALINAWHIIQLGYYETLLRNCMDFEMKVRYQRKIQYLKLKLDDK